MTTINNLGKTIKISATGAVKEDLSGAMTELASTVTAGKKLLAQSLTNKGITNIKYTDALPRMAEAVDALNAEGVGLDPKIPLLILPKTVTRSLSTENQLTATNGQWRKLPGKPNIIWRNYSSGVRLADTAGRTFDGSEPTDLDITVEAIRGALGLASSDLTYYSYPKFFYDAATNSFLWLTKDHKFIKVTIIFADNLAESTWRAELIFNDVIPTDNSNMSSNVENILCYNSSHNKAIAYYASEMFMIDCATGNYFKFTFPDMIDTYSSPPIFYGYDYNGVSAFICKSFDQNYNTPLRVYYIDWENTSNIDYVDSSETFNSRTGFLIDYELGKVLTSNFGDFNLSNKTYTPGRTINITMVGDEKSVSGSRDRTFARINAENGDIVQLDSWCRLYVFTPQGKQRLLTGNYNGVAAMAYSSYGMTTPGNGSYMTLGHMLSIEGKLCFCENEKIYEAIVDYTRFLCWPITRNGQTVYLKPAFPIGWDDFMASDSPFLRTSITLPVELPLEGSEATHNG